MSEPTSAQPQRISMRSFVFLFVLISIVGSVLRIADSGSWRRTGFDEMIYRRYVNMMDGGKHTVGVFQRDYTLAPYQITVEGTGMGAMPDLCGLYLDSQAAEKTECELPPTRFLYIYTSWLWKRVQFGDDPPLPPSELQPRSLAEDRANDPDHRDPALASLHRVACTFAIFLMIAGGLVAWRMAGPEIGLGVLALMAFSPVQLHFSQHALIDGFFAFWALMCLWTTWECMKNPAAKGWLIAHGIFLAVLPLAKLENAFFVCCGIGAIIVANRWLKIGTTTPKFLLVSFFTPLIGILVLISLAGGADTFFAVYKMFVTKAQTLEAARLFGDGPWYRYFIDMITISPIVVLLAVGALFKLTSSRKELAFVAVFVAASYLIMCNLKYGMNLRFTSIWEMPFRLGAMLIVADLCAGLRHRHWLGAAVIVAGLCAYDLRQYNIFASDPAIPLYEFYTKQMLELVNIIKSK